MQIKNYEDAVKYLASFIGKIVFKVDRKTIKQHDPLERMRVFLSLLGNPQEKFKSVLVGGTSGKGSTAYLISHILTTAGYKTGLTLSPHLEKVNERLQINEQQISDLEFTKMTASMIRIIENMEKMDVGAPARHRLAKASAGGPSYFEILVGMAFTYFAREKVDMAVVEVGMGGEFDATNTLNPLIAVLTNVSLDHTNILGKTVEKIAKTKAGIIKNHQIVITGVKQRSVIKIIEEKCREVGAKLYRLEKDFKLTNLKLSLLGDYQVENASLAVQTVVQLRKFGFKVKEEDIRKALSTAFFPGRFEILRLTSFAQDKISSTLILDGAHNPTKMRAFLSTLKKLYPKERKIFLVGFKFDKDISKMLKQIVKVADRIIVTEFKAKTDVAVHASAKALNLKSLIFNLKSNVKVVVEKDSEKALHKALNYPITQLPNYQSIIVVTGSLYLVGEIRSML